MFGESRWEEQLVRSEQPGNSEVEKSVNVCVYVCVCERRESATVGKFAREIANHLVCSPRASSITNVPG